jgi:dihydrofolate reductase
MKHFKELTEHNYVLMGRFTYDSIGTPLKNRINIILTRNKKYETPKGTFVYNSFEKVINSYKNLNDEETELFVIGGANLYSQALHYADRIYLTIVENTFPEADTFFPKFSLNEWKVISHQKHSSDETHPFNYNFVTYERRINTK